MTDPNLEFLMVRVAGLQDEVRDIRMAEQTLAERLETLETTVEALGKVSLTRLNALDRRMSRLEARMDSLVDSQARMGDRLAAGQKELAEQLVEVLRRLPPR